MPECKNISLVLSVGLPSALTVLFYDVANVFLNKLMSLHGDHQLAALGIVLKAERLPLNTGVGLCQGMMPLVAYNYAAKNERRMNAMIRTARISGSIISAFSILLYEVFSGSIVRVFISASAGNVADAARTVGFGISFLCYRCLAAPFAFMNFHITYTLQAIGDGKNTLMLAALRQCIFYIPIMFIMDYFFGADGLVWTQIIAELITLCIAFGILKKKT